LIVQVNRTASTQLYDALFEFTNRRKLATCAISRYGLMVVGLIQENREFEWVVSQSRVLYAQSTQRRFSRWFLDASRHTGAPLILVEF